VALWAADLEAARAFYVDVLGGVAGAKYVNARTGFESYFVSFGAGARIELMRRPDLAPHAPAGDRAGYAHVALAAGSPEAVDAFAARLRERGITVVSGPRLTGDGYYELAFDDPEGNRVELMA
jgi:lactoylglutathione lyase